MPKPKKSVAGPIDRTHLRLQHDVQVLQHEVAKVAKLTERLDEHLKVQRTA